MLTEYTCRCGLKAEITSQGDIPLVITTADPDFIEVEGTRYPLKNEKGESLKNVLNGKAEYWTPPAVPKNPPAPAPTEPGPTH
jgi:hypothetical protein